MWDPSATEAYVTNGDMDWGVERALFDFTEAGGTFVDVGAHTGYYSVLMAPKIMRAIAVEPNARCQTALRNNLKEVSAARQIRAFAGDKPGYVAYRDNEQGFSYGSFDGGTDLSGQMEVVTVDALTAEDLYKVTAIKIDVDGPDLLVLDGARETIKRDRPVVVIESQVDEPLLKRSHALGYATFAPCRYGRSPRTTWERVTKPDARRRTKMVFLVSNERAEAFERFIFFDS